MKNLSKCPEEKVIYFWNIVGSMSNALASIILLMLVTRILGTGMGDVFSIAWAIAQLMLTVGTFQVRLYQATDVRETFRFRQYFIFRIITVAFMIIGTLGYTVVKGYSTYKTVIIMILCLFKAVDALCDVYEGCFQQRDRLDLTGKALTYRVVISTVVLGTILWMTKNLIFGCAGMLVSAVFSFLFFNLTYAKKINLKIRKTKQVYDGKWIWKMIFTCAPLFINAFLVISIFNAPKMSIDVNIEQGTMEAGLQTIYGILFMPASVMNLAYIIFRPMITQMAVGWNNKDLKRFFGLMKKITLYLFGIGIVVMLGGMLFGIKILSFIYGIDLQEYQGAFLILLLGGAVNTLVNIFDNALTVIRRQHMLVISYVITWIYSMIVSPILVLNKGVLGASVSFLSSMLVLLISIGVLFFTNIWKINDEREKTT